MPWKSQAVNVVMDKRPDLVRVRHISVATYAPSAEERSEVHRGLWGDWTLYDPLRPQDIETDLFFVPAPVDAEKFIEFEPDMDIAGRWLCVEDPAIRAEREGAGRW